MPLSALPLSAWSREAILSLKMELGIFLAVASYTSAMVQEALSPREIVSVQKWALQMSAHFPRVSNDCSLPDLFFGEWAFLLWLTHSLGHKTYGNTWYCT